MAKSWCKVSATLDTHPKVRRAGNLGRQVFEFALRRNSELDESGMIPRSHMEPWYLADVLMLTEADALSGLSHSVRAGLLEENGAYFSIVGWNDEWAKKPLTEAERKRRQRATARDDSSTDQMSRNCPDTDGTNRDSPECHAREEKRREEDKKEGDVAALDLSLPPEPPDPGPPDRAVEIAALAIAEINRLKRSQYSPHTETTLDDARKLAKRKRTDDEILLVIRSKAKWVGNEEMHQHFCPATLLGPKNFSKYLDEAQGASPVRAGPSSLRIASASDDPDLTNDPFAARP